MNSINIELWRVGPVVCLWLTDWRRIQVISAGEILSDQTLTSPSEALASARELRRFFRFIHATGAGQKAGASTPVARFA